MSDETCEEIQINQFYRYVGEDKKEAKDFEGGLVLVAAFEDNTVHYVSGENTFEDDIDLFVFKFDHAPNGAMERQEQIQTLLTEMNTEQAELTLADIALSLPSIEASSSGDDIQTSTSRALTALGDKKKVTRMKQAITRGQYQIKRTALQLQSKMERIQSLMSERKEAMDIQIEKMNRAIVKMEEAVWTINLYLGSNETLVQLQSGEPAPASEKIAIRQQVLWMAEECAVASDKGGIDIQNMEEFDKWIVASPAHLNQVLPELKGIVACKITRIEKPTGDSYYDAALSKKNKHTYFLLRNGENVYRIDTDLEVFAALLPTQTEFSKIFEYEDHHYDWKKHESQRETVIIRPGTPRYERAMEKAEARERHYMRILLFIQGLLDRTEVFKPYPWAAEQINVMDKKANKDFMTYVYDAENLLGTGRPSFRDWLEELNSRLDVGHRIIGAFGSYGADFDKKERVSPRNAERPDSLALYTIERRGDKDGEFVFLYRRTVKEWMGGSWGYGQELRLPKTRASCRIDKSDRFILNIDDVEIADMEYYLANRTDRHEFVDMFPVLKTAIKIKRKEAKEEAPFRKLLIGQMAQVVSGDCEHAESRVDELIQWWKFKNKTHRALTSKDDLALSMIVTEYKIRIEKEKKRRAGAARFQLFADVLAKTNERVIYIGHKNNNECVVLIPENDQSVFVQEETWTVARNGEAKHIDTKRWRTVDKRCLRWLDLFTTERWQQWSFDVRGINYLTDVERDALLEAAWPKIKTEAKERTDYRDRKVKNRAWLPLCATIDQNQKLCVYVCYTLGAIYPKRPFTGAHAKPKVFHEPIPWARKAGEVVAVSHYRSGGDITYSPDNRYWEGRYARGERVFWKNQENIDRVDAEFKAFGPVKAAREAIEEQAGNIQSQVKHAMQERRLAIEFSKFMAEVGDESLWETHKADLNLREVQWRYEVRMAACYCIERGLSIAGMTLQELLDQAKEFGMKEEISDDLPFAFVLSEPATENEDEENEDEEEEEKKEVTH